jgi:hypothetical protein
VVLVKPSVRTELKITVAVLLVLLTALWVFSGTTHNQFVWDSIAYLLVFERHISSLNMDNVFWMLSSLHMGNWHPLTWFSWAIDYQVFGSLDPWAFHVSNNILHAINSGLVFVLTLVVFGLNKPANQSFPIRFDNSALLSALIATLFFAIHPQHVETVAWVAERKGLLCQFFMLLSILAYTRYVSCDNRSKWWWYVGALGLYVLALLSKPMAVTLPVVLLLIDVYPFRRTVWIHSKVVSIPQRSLSGLILEKLPFLLLSAGLALITIHSQQVAMWDMPFELRMLNAFNSVLFYLEKLLLPFSFSPHYPYFIGTYEPITWLAYLPIIGFLAISGLTIKAWLSGHPAWMIAWLFYLFTLLPVLGLIVVGTQGAADRYAYFPTLPVYILIGAGVLAVLQRASDSIKGLVLAAIVALLLILVNITREQVRVWQNEMTLWKHAINLQPDNVYAQSSLGKAYYLAGDHDAAISHLEIAMGLPVYNADLLAWRGLTYMRLERFEDALSDLVNLGITAESTPGFDVDQYCIQYNIGWLFAQMHRPEDAVEMFGRVEPGSRPGPDAQIWLDHLEDASQQKLVVATNFNLPEFCQRMIPMLGADESVL